MSSHDSEIVFPPGYDRRSGLHLAAEAHEQNAVETPERMPHFDVSVSFVCHSDENQVRQSVKAMTDHLALVDGVSQLSSSVTQRLEP